MEVPDLVMLTQELIPGTIYRIKGDNTTWKYALVLKQINDKKEIIVLSPKKNIVKKWIINKMFWCELCKHKKLRPICLQELAIVCWFVFFDTIRRGPWPPGV